MPMANQREMSVKAVTAPTPKINIGGIPASELAGDAAAQDTRRNRGSSKKSVRR